MFRVFYKEKEERDKEQLYEDRLKGEDYIWLNIVKNGIIRL